MMLHYSNIAYYSISILWYIHHIMLQAIVLRRPSEASRLVLLVDHREVSGVYCICIICIDIVTSIIIVIVIIRSSRARWSGISRIRFVRSSNRIPCSSKVVSRC